MSGVKEITWCTDVVFRHAVAKSFGQGRVWLAGDAAHQTGPVGAQSMNIGILEAESLVGRLCKELQGGTEQADLVGYNAERLKEWQSLLGMTQSLGPSSATPPWVAERYARLVPCIPGSGESLIRLGGQLGLTVAK